jgi:hypothetical protein
MRVEADRTKHQVILRGDRGTEITLSWSGALLLGTMLRQASVQAEPSAPRPGRTYCPSTERERR